MALVMYFGLGVITGLAQQLWSFRIHSFVVPSCMDQFSNHTGCWPLNDGQASVDSAATGKPVMRIDTFGYGFVFAFGMALNRFMFTTR